MDEWRKSCSGWAFIARAVPRSFQLHPPPRKAAANYLVYLVFTCSTPCIITLTQRPLSPHMQLQCHHGGESHERQLCPGASPDNYNPGRGALTVPSRYITMSFECLLSVNLAAWPFSTTRSACKTHETAASAYKCYRNPHVLHGLCIPQKPGTSLGQSPNVHLGATLDCGWVHS